MNEDFVTYKQAVKLKEFGFDWECVIYSVTEPFSISTELSFIVGELVNSLIADTHRNNTIPRPTLAQAAKWLREVKGIIIICTPKIREYDFNDYIRQYLPEQWQYELWRGDEEYWDYMGKTYPTYESALSAGIDEALSLLTDDAPNDAPDDAESKLSKKALEWANANCDHSQEIAIRAYIAGFSDAQNNN